MLLNNIEVLICQDTYNREILGRLLKTQNYSAETGHRKYNGNTLQTDRRNREYTEVIIEIGRAHV